MGIKVRLVRVVYYPVPTVSHSPKPSEERHERTEKFAVRKI